MAGTQRILYGVAELCLTPRSIFSPIPYFAIFLYLLSINTHTFTLQCLRALSWGVLFTLVGVSASNLWNHTNDLEDDIIAGKENLLTEGQMSKRSALALSTLLYASSIALSLHLTHTLGRDIWMPLLIWAVITWLYSDKIFTGARLKSHYIGELLTYIVAYPCFTLTTWLIYSENLLQGMVVASAFAFLGVSGVLLKDLKDISGDRRAGLRTLGVIFPPSTLIHASCILLMLYYLTLIISGITSIFSIGTLLILIPFAYYMKKTFLHFTRKNWRLSEGDHIPIGAMMMTTYGSLLLLGVGSLIQIA
ncbi:1,4-dihydroxy-2-naphthoate octaprenyltransferase [Candidatus Methanoperedenaceae archaeon GB50]|nr:1,4-dihydroxy-2-naphthoate octaprenyltransferase [Candidatus Methanoperedenaceae archaeon GB37]CAD7775873.1 1,4-dihydroxy-2-naphthoate octaprenyltransferase [Candidatus Methanoperedenaceae archaeon GB50]CAD7781499.1 MAG: 1,4-dihydroxy-2-naphthoate octaprenyltransferase [Candidatus Methanoperedenaceae archaeon GB50]